MQMKTQMQMNGKSGLHRPRPAWPGWMGALLAIIGIIIGIALLAACSGPSTSSTTSSGGSASSAYRKALEYAQCVRAHGEPNYPDPNSKGQFVVPNGSSPVNVSKAVADAVNRACGRLAAPLPGSAQASQGANTASQSLRFAECMRSHGALNYPDPNPDGSFTLPKGANPQSPQWQAAERDCQKLMPQNPGGSAP
jgi:hypothetical protein